MLPVAVTVILTGSVCEGRCDLGLLLWLRRLTRSDGAVIFEALAYADVSTTAYLTIHNMIVSILDRCAAPLRSLGVDLL